MCNANTKHWQIRVTTGPGGVILRNNSEVFGKTRKVKAFTIGLLTNANLTYKLNPNLGVSLGVQYMYSELLRIRTHYHGERVIVKLDGNNDTNLTRINFTTGIILLFLTFTQKSTMKKYILILFPLSAFGSHGR